MTYLTGMPFFDNMFLAMEQSKLEQERKNRNITSQAGFDGIEDLIPHIYDNIKFEDGLYKCLRTGNILDIYDSEMCIFKDLSSFKSLGRDFFLASVLFDVEGEKNPVELGALCKGADILTDYIFKSNIFSKFSDKGDFCELSTDFMEKVIINTKGEIVFTPKSYFDSLTLKNNILLHKNSIINLLTQEVILDDVYSSTHCETEDLYFAQIGNKNSVIKINTITGEYEVFGKPLPEPKSKTPVKSEKKPVEDKTPKEPVLPPQQRNELCRCGSGKKFKNCCLGKK